jgi:hypothetical protein
MVDFIDGEELLNPTWNEPDPNAGYAPEGAIPGDKTGNDSTELPDLGLPGDVKSYLSWGHPVAIYYPFEPSPLYLNNSVVFQKPSNLAPVDDAEAVYPLHYDPLRPHIGHWRKPLNEIMNPPYIGTALWWDTTNNVYGSPPYSENFDFGKKFHRRFVRPAVKLYGISTNVANDSGYGSSPFMESIVDPKSVSGDKTTIEETEKYYNFRFLATNTVTVEMTNAHPEWEEAYLYYLHNFDNSESSKKTLYGKLNAAIEAGPLPHGHEGLIDKNGVGFTVSMHIEPKYLELWKVIQGFAVEGSQTEQYGKEVMKKIMPTYHTHVLGPVAQSNVGVTVENNVDNYNHRNYNELYGDPHEYPYKYTGIYDNANYGAHKPTYQVGWEMNHWKWVEDPPPGNQGGLIEWTTIDEGAVTSPVFLEFMHLYYNNEELHDIIRLVEKDVEDGLVPSADENPSDPYFMSEFKWEYTFPQSQDSIQQERDVNDKYHYKLRKLKKYLIDTYVSKMQHTPSYSYKTLKAHKVFQDKVFEPKTISLGSLGSRESRFNYTKPYYEKATNLLSQHKLIPNPYLSGQYKEDPVRFGQPGEMTPGLFSPEYQSLLSLGNEELLKKVEKNGLNINAYLRNWSKVMIAKAGQYDILGINQDAIMGFPNYDFIKKYNPIPYLYPWYAKLMINTPSPLSSKSSEFPDKRGTFIADIFKDTKDELILFFMARVADKNPSTSTSIGEQYYEQDFYVRDKSSLEETKIETFNFSDWIAGEAGLWAQDEFNTKTDNLISFDLGLEEKVNNATRDSIENAFIEFKDKIEEFHNTRSTYEILDASNTSAQGQNDKYGYKMHPFAHNEIMFYEIEKYSTDLLLPDKLVQKYFIAAPSGKNENVIEFFDSQMQIETGYHYKVNVYVLVIGNKYQYVDIQTRGLKLIKQSLGDFREEIVGPGSRGRPGGRFGEDGRPTSGDRGEGVSMISDETFKYYIEPVENAFERNKFVPIADIFVLNKPNIELLKIPYTSFQTVYVANKPPLYPNVVVYPYKNVNNKLLFALSQFVGKRTERPVEILPTDKEIFMKAALGQEKIDADDFELPVDLEFQSDEPDIRYQVFRVEKHPTSWSDFASGLHRPMLDAKGGYRELIQHENDFVDNVSPNKKYYYVFRSIDSRGYISNPSPIYQVELVDDSGAIYLVVKIVNFKPKVPKKTTKSLRKYVHIFPTLKQSNMIAPKLESIFSGESVVFENAQLGDLFGNDKTPRRFKIRFTSKSSGKKFDLNLRFVHEHMQIDFAKFIEKEVNPSKGSGAPKNEVQVVKDTDSTIPDSVKAEALGGSQTLDDLY